MKKVFLLALLCAVFLASSCNTTRKSVQITTPIGAAPLSEPVLTLPVSAPPRTVPAPGLEIPGRARPASERIRVTLKLASDIFSEGEALFRRGDRQEARARFDLALETIRGASVSVLDAPQLDRFLNHMLLDIRLLEQSALEEAQDEEEADAGVVQKLEPAAVDALENVNLFQIEIDPHLREVVNSDILGTRYDVPMVINDRVLRSLEYFQKRGRSSMENGLKRSGKYMPLFHQIFKEEGVPLDLAHLAQVESLYKPNAFSRARAKGIWQFMSYTGNDYGLRQNFWVDERSDVEKSTRAAARYLKALHEMFGDWYLALGAYNWGPGRIERLLNRHGALSFWEMMDKDYLPQETFNYVPSILATIIIAKNPEKYGFHQVQYEAPLAFDKVPMRGQLDLRVASELIGTEVQHLLELNPELVRGITPKDLDFSLRVPQGLGEELEEQLAQLPSSRWVRNESYQIRPGDTLASIARRRGMSKFSLASANDLTVRSRLKVGSELVIPAHLWMKPAFEAQTTLATRTRMHRVRRGENLGSIARRYNISVAALRSWNRLGTRSVLRVDQRLVIRRPASARALRSATARTKGTKVASRPAAGAPAASKSHHVRKGESLASIARRYKVNVAQLRKWNGLASGTIQAGSRLVILTPLSK